MEQWSKTSKCVIILNDNALSLCLYLYSLFWALCMQYLVPQGQRRFGVQKIHDVLRDAGSPAFRNYILFLKKSLIG